MTPKERNDEEIQETKELLERKMTEYNDASRVHEENPQVFTYKLNLLADAIRGLKARLNYLEGGVIGATAAP